MRNVAGDEYRLRRTYERRFFAVIGALAVIAGLVGSMDAEPKNIGLYFWPGFGFLIWSLLVPRVWRGNAPARRGAFLYLGLPVGFAGVAPIAALPASYAGNIACGVGLAIAGVVFVIELSEVVIGETAITDGGRRIAFEDVTELRMDHLITEGTEVSYVRVGGGGRRIALASPYFAGDVQNAIATLANRARTAISDRACSAIIEGKSFVAGPITFAPSGITIRRPSKMTLGPTIFLFAVLGFFPTLLWFAAADDGHRSPARMAIATAPLAGALAIIGLAAWWRRRHPVVIEPGRFAHLSNDQLMIPRDGKKPIAIELRFLTNGHVVPLVADFLARHDARDRGA